MLYISFSDKRKTTSDKRKQVTFVYNSHPTKEQNVLQNQFIYPKEKGATLTNINPRRPSKDPSTCNKKQYYDSKSCFLYIANKPINPKCL